MMYRRDHTPPQIVSEGVEAVVKWFNTQKGFGFVKMSEDPSDAFLHASVLTRLGFADLPPGTRVLCNIAEGKKGLQVAEIVSIEEMGTEEPMSGLVEHSRPANGSFNQSVEATVKFFNAEKGFGFAIPDDGSKDVYISMRVLERAGLGGLDANQRVRLDIRIGEKGPMARSITLL